MLPQYRIDYKQLVEQENKKFERRFNFFVVVIIITIFVVLYLYFKYNIPMSLIIVMFIRLSFFCFIIYKYISFIFYINQLFCPPFSIRLNLLSVHILFIVSAFTNFLILMLSGLLILICLYRLVNKKNNSFILIFTCFLLGLILICLYYGFLDIV